LNAFRRFIKSIPPWAFMLVLLVIVVDTAYLIYRHRLPLGGATVKFENGYYIHEYVNSRGSVYKAGIKTGDTIVSMNSIPIEEWKFTPEVGDTLIAGILRNNQEVGIPVVIGSVFSFFPGFFITVYIIVIIFSIGSLYILFKKPRDQSVKLFFICIQLFMIVENALNLHSKDHMALFANFVFMISGCMLGPVLMHFHLLFPKPAKIISKYSRLTLIFYMVGFLCFIVYAVSYFKSLFPGDSYLGTHFSLIDRIVLFWMTLTFFLALAIVIFQFRTIRDTLSRNQLRIVITGTFFGFLTPMALSIFYDQVTELSGKYPNIISVAQGAGSVILIGSILVAIFRYRIWDIEVFLRKALLYLGATLVIILSYLFMIYLVDLLTIRETKVTRFVILAVSVIIFLVVRDRLQRLIDRIFHRETYDSAMVVADFEEKLAGIYRLDELKTRIAQGLDEIFHFRSFIMSLKKEGMTYEPVLVLGLDDHNIQSGTEFNNEFISRLRKSQVFSPGELDNKPALFETVSGELIVPMVKDDQPYGFFLCGPKKSEKTYSLQDIRVLSLIARRVIALFHTADLFQRDLDRQLMLERERARIAQDMHDDIGAGLTKIAMISEGGMEAWKQGGGGIGRSGDLEIGRLGDLEIGRLGDLESGRLGDLESDNRERLVKVATAAREMIRRLNVIVWALNPRYDNLDSLVSYVRRYFGEYLENFGIDLKMQVSGDIPDLPVSPDFRRNAFYAWQEAIHNAVKHGACSEIKIDVKIIGQTTMEVSITDNGKGFDQARPVSGGNGLLNMKKRAEELGGTFSIESKVGKGTRVLFIIRLQ
jgi:signal transduction histidine kinase